MNSRQIYWLAEIAAANARIAGMQAENAACAVLNETPNYTDADFRSEAAGLGHIAEAARNDQ